MKSQKDTAEVTFVVLLITMVEQFNVFFVRFTDKSTAIINLVFRNRNAIVKMWKNSRYGFGFRAWVKDPRIDQLRNHVIEIKLKSFLSRQYINGIFYI